MNVETSTLKIRNWDGLGTWWSLAGFQHQRFDLQHSADHQLPVDEFKVIDSGTPPPPGRRAVGVDLGCATVVKKWWVSFHRRSGKISMGFNDLGSANHPGCWRLSPPGWCFTTFLRVWESRGKKLLPKCHKRLHPGWGLRCEETVSPKICFLFQVA